MDIPKLLRVKEASERTGLAAWRFYDLIARGKGPPHMRVGKTIRIAETALVEWIEGQHRKPTS